MAAVIRLARRGKRNSPFYHMVIADKKKPRDSSFIEVVGTYSPTDKEHKVVINKERVDYWLKKGVVPSETISQLLKNL